MGPKKMDGLIKIDQGIVTTIQGSGTFIKAQDLDRATFNLEGLHFDHGR